jgi:hypothetical protein
LRGEAFTRRRLDHRERGAELARDPIPLPVSVILTSTGPSSRASTVTATSPPRLLYFTALTIRLMSTCLSR